MSETSQGVIVRGPDEGELIGGRGPLVKAFGAETADTFAVLEGGLPPRTEGPGRHVHRAHGEGSCVLEGTMTLSVGAGSEPFEETEAPAGSWVYVPPGVPHTFASRSDVQLAFIGVCNAGIEILLGELAEALDDGEEPDRSKLVAVLERWQSEYA